MRLRVGWIVLWLLLAARFAGADGFFMPKLAYSHLHGELGATSTEQKGVVIEIEDGRQALLIQTTYHGPAADFAWVIPVPGEPGDGDVFIAASDFIDGIFRHSAPVVRTRIEMPEPARARGTWSEGFDLSDGPPQPERVTLHRRMQVGDYEVSVLSATGPEVLIDWLNEHGYATPEEHADLLGHYVEKAWYFVALRALPAVAEERPILDDVRPIGIEFATEKLTYPLHISRGSSREKTALTLIALTRDPVECENLTRVRIPLGEHGQGTSYARIRRELIERHPDGPAAVLEYAGYGVVGRGALSWRDGEWPAPDQGDLRELWATRLWTIIERDEMEDLTFASAAVRGDRTVIERYGELPDPDALEGLGRMDIPVWPVAGVVFLVLATGGIAARRVPLPLLYAALSLGAMGVFSIVLPPALQSWAALLCFVLVVVTVIVALAGAKTTDEDVPLPLFRITIWVLLAAGYVVAVQYVTGYPAAEQRYLNNAQMLGLLIWATVLVFEVVRGVLMMQRGDRFRALAAFAIATGALLWLMPLRLPRSTRASFPDTEGLLTGGLAAVMVLVLAWGVLSFIRRDRSTSRTEHAGIAAAATAVGLGVVWAVWEPLLAANSPFQVHLMRLTFPLMALIPLTVLFGFAWGALSCSGALGRAARAFALTLLVLGAGLSFGRVGVLSPAIAGKAITARNALNEHNRALEALDRAIHAFLDDTGSYPATLDDLTSEESPEVAIDSSGNEVEGPERWAGPYLTELPEDPLTQARDTWVYEVTGSPMIASGGLTITISREDTPELQREERGELPPHPARLSANSLQMLSRSPDGRVMRFLPVGMNAFMAWPQQHEAYVLSMERGRLVRSLSADESRAAIAGRDAPAQIRLCDLFPPKLPTEDLDSDGGWVSGVVDLIDGHWPVGIHDLALHPEKDRIAAFARIQGYRIGERGDAHLTRVYLIEEGAVPAAVPGGDGCVEIEWMNEEDLVGLFADLPSHPFVEATPPGTLKRIMPDGRTETIANDVPSGLWHVADGRITAASQGRGVVMIDPDGASAVIEPPEDGLMVDDLLIDGQELGVAWGPAEPNEAASIGTSSGADVGAIYVYKLGETTGTEIARYSRNVTNANQPCKALIAGKDDATGAWVVVLVEANRSPRMYFALWPDRPPHRLMQHSTDNLMNREAWLYPEQLTVSFAGWLPGYYFSAGDLYAEYDSAAMSRHRLETWQAGGPLEDAAPVLGRSDFFLKLQRVP